MIGLTSGRRRFTANLEIVCAIVEGAGRANGGHVLDSWHVFRGGQTLDKVAALPGDRIFAVELDDAAPEIRGALLEDTVRHRRFCGAGAFDLVAFVHAVDAAGL